MDKARICFEKGLQRFTEIVGRLGFEPGMTEPKPVVLPLHHRPKCGCKVSENLAYRQIFTNISYLTISK